MTTPNLTGNWSLDFPNESVKVIQWHGFFSVLLICFCSAFAIISTAGKSMIIYFILYKAPKRPMNTMILLDQVSVQIVQWIKLSKDSSIFQIGTMLTSLVTKVMTITSLIMATPLLDMYGTLGCDVYFHFTIAHNILVVTGGFVMALFRMLCVRFDNYVPSLERLMLLKNWCGCNWSSFWSSGVLMYLLSMYMDPAIYLNSVMDTQPR